MSCGMHEQDTHPLGCLSTNLTCRLILFRSLADCRVCCNPSNSTVAPVGLPSFSVSRRFLFSALLKRSSSVHGSRSTGGQCPVGDAEGEPLRGAAARVPSHPVSRANLALIPESCAWTSSKLSTSGSLSCNRTSLSNLDKG